MKPILRNIPFKYHKPSHMLSLTSILLSLSFLSLYPFSSILSEIPVHLEMNELCYSCLRDSYQIEFKPCQCMEPNKKKIHWMSVLPMLSNSCAVIDIYIINMIPKLLIMLTPPTLALTQTLVMTVYNPG